MTSAFNLGSLRFDSRRLKEFNMALAELWRESCFSLEASSNMLVLQGRKRFGPPTEEQESALRSIEDLSRLERIGERMFDATGWDDLLATE